MQDVGSKEELSSIVGQNTEGDDQSVWGGIGIVGRNDASPRDLTSRVGTPKPLYTPNARETLSSNNQLFPPTAALISRATLLLPEHCATAQAKTPLSTTRPLPYPSLDVWYDICDAAEVQCQHILKLACIIMQSGMPKCDMFSHSAFFLQSNFTSLKTNHCRHLLLNEATVGLWPLPYDMGPASWVELASFNLKLCKAKAKYSTF
jgi:hypothetical protein